MTLAGTLYAGALKARLLVAALVGFLLLWATPAMATTNITAVEGTA